MKVNKKLSIAGLALFLSLVSVSVVEAQEDGVVEASVQARVAGNWVNSNGDWFYSVNGVNQKGWIFVDGAWYHLNGDGVMARGWVVVGGAWYYLNTDGSMATGWTVVDGAWYYLDASGAMATGWLLLGDSWYYLHGNGLMATGWLFEGDAWFYLNADGSMATNWIIVNGVWYYLDLAGRMLTNTTLGDWEIDGNGVATEIIKTNKERLMEVIAEVEGLQEIDYREDGSWSKFATALAKAKAIVKDSKATELAMAVALEDLEVATAKLVVLTADKVELFKEIKAQEAENYEEADYTPASWKVYQAALTEAKRVYADKAALQSEVEAARKALAEVELAIVLTGRPALKAAIESAEKTYLVDEKVEADYTKESWIAFKVAYYEAQTVYAKEDYTDAVIQKAIDDLAAAIDGLVDAEGSIDELADLLSVLQVAKATAKLEADFSKKSFKAFDKALVKADAIFEGQEESSTKAIREAKLELEATMKALVNVKELKAEIALAKEITNEKDYTLTSWRRFAKALDQANEVLANPEAPKKVGEADLTKAAAQEKVDSATAELKAANATLIYTKDQEALDLAIKTAKGLKATDYTRISYAAVTSKLKATESLPASPTGAQVRNATMELNSAIGNVAPVVDEVKFTDLTKKHNLAVERTKASGYVTSIALEAAIKKAATLLFAKAGDTTVITDYGNVAMKDVLEAINELDKVLSIK